MTDLVSLNLSDQPQHFTRHEHFKSVVCIINTNKIITPIHVMEMVRKRMMGVIIKKSLHFTQVAHHADGQTLGGNKLQCRNDLVNSQMAQYKQIQEKKRGGGYRKDKNITLNQALSVLCTNFDQVLLLRSGLWSCAYLNFHETHGLTSVHLLSLFIQLFLLHFRK